MNFKQGNSFAENNLRVINRVRSEIRQIAGVVAHQILMRIYNQVVNIGN